MKKAISKIVEAYEIRCVNVRASVSSDVTVSWLTDPSIWTSSSSRLVELPEQIRRRANMSMGKEYRCLYCNDFVTKLEEHQYPHHVFTKHKGYLPYATELDLKSPKAGKQTVGKRGKSYNEWRHTQESKIFCTMMKKAKQKWWRQQLSIQKAHQQPMIRKALDCYCIRVRTH